MAVFLLLIQKFNTTTVFKSFFNMDPQILDENLDKQSSIRRRKLLPWWIKVFIWIFMIFGVIAIPAIIIGLMGFSFDISLYGLSTQNPISIVGLSLIVVFLFKGFTSYALWTEKYY